jgi:hypothetical protein
MKKIGISIAICTIIFAANGLAQDNTMPYLLKESIKKNVAQLKSGIVGSYPRHTEEFKYETDWVPFRTIETSYTSFGEPSVVEYNQGGNRTMDLYSYNDSHRQTEVKNQAMIDGIWVNQSRQVMSYNNQGYELEFRNEQWNGTGWDLVAGSQLSYETDGERITVLTSKSWNSDTSTWENSMRETYTYSASGILYSSSIMDMWDNGWVPTLKNEYTWTTGNQVWQWLSYTYDNGEWVLSSKTIYEYQTNNSTIMTSYSYLGPETWMATSRITITYDSHGNSILNQMEMNMGEWTIFSSTRYQLTYAGNNVTERITQAYSLFPPAVKDATTTITWKNILKEVFSNFASLSTDITQLPEAGLRVFPNPTGKQAIVRLSVLKAGPVSLSVFSMTGQKILEEVFTPNGSDVNFVLNLDGVRPGSYVLIARDKQGSEIGKTRLIKDKE